MTTEALVRKADIGEIRLREVAEAPLTDGQVRVRIESFALTANNVTYAAFGDAMDYWRFFPSGREGWGIVPVWGFASVTQSNHPGVAVGERLYGFWPMASGTVLQPVKLSPGGFADGQAHREGLHAVYNQYQRCALDPLWTAKTEDIQALLRPLFTTAWLIDDFLADNAFFGADTVLLSSASSKTASATAFHLKQRGNVEVIGLTAGSRREYCERLGCYTPGAALRRAGAAAARPAPGVCRFRRPRRVAPGHPHPFHTAQARRRDRQHALRAPRAARRCKDAARPGRHLLLRAGPGAQAHRRLGPGRLRRAYGAGLVRLRRQGHRPGGAMVPHPAPRWRRGGAGGLDAGAWRDRASARGAHPLAHLRPRARGTAP